jgi:hypothetical protein
LSTIFIERFYKNYCKKMKNSIKIILYNKMNTLINYYTNHFSTILLSRNLLVITEKDLTSPAYTYKNRSLYQILSFFWSIGQPVLDTDTLVTLYCYRQKYKKNNVNIDTMSQNSAILLYCAFTCYRNIYNVESQPLNTHIDYLSTKIF